ncbi:DUF2461 domain-containing protein [Jannaschia sp. Os4]|uniref:DUF2461 domain-containing protein n=1 Tax=Jannaschia sp. Os4 TaxID=2807617 RepID=UPI00193A2D06|nr:DUF2461 domain-containing protein [Jannaschia sp. Os4]MBM2575287.1 DUF2461 domain-containing protein [Jannaschia sp. Os4]
MSDGFTEMLDRAQAFYGDLARNNSKAWFEPRKARWKADIEAPAKLLADLVAEDVSRLTGAAHAGKVFRIHRDVRFSKDKSPYKTSLALLWSAPEEGPAFYFAIEPEDVVLGLGAPGLSKEGLLRWRDLVDRRGDDLTDAVEAAGARWGDFGPEPLKRVPKPYDPDHPHGDLLRRKSVVVLGGLPEGWRADGLVAGIADGFARLLTVRAILAEGLGEGASRG